jgi:hypothetical protein
MLNEKNINVVSCMPTKKSDGNAVLIFRFDGIEKAIETLRRENVRVPTGEEVRRL